MNVSGEERRKRQAIRRRHPRWTERDGVVLRWIAEQYGVRRDQLAVLLAWWGQVPTQTPGVLGSETVRDWVQRWRGAGVLGSVPLVVGEPSWVWVTRLGLDHLGLEYRYWEPKARSLPHLHAINQARWMVEVRYPQAIWRSERALRAGQPFAAGQTQGDHQPDAEVQLGAQRIAIEVELTAKSKKRQPAILYGLARRYDAIWYFCPPALEAHLQQSFAQLEAAARRKFSLVVLPQEQTAVSAQPATPPRPTSGT